MESKLAIVNRYNRGNAKKKRDELDNRDISRAKEWMAKSMENSTAKSNRRSIFHNKFAIGRYCCHGKQVLDWSGATNKTLCRNNLCCRYRRNFAHWERSTKHYWNWIISKDKRRRKQKYATGISTRLHSHANSEERSSSKMHMRDINTPITSERGNNT